MGVAVAEELAPVFVSRPGNLRHKHQGMFKAKAKVNDSAFNAGMAAAPRFR